MNALLRAALAATELRALYERARGKPRRILIAVLAGWIAAIFTVAALFWFDAALWFYCEPRLGAPVAALISGGALLLAALLALLPIALSSPRSQPTPSPAIAANELAVTVLQEATKLFRHNKGTIMLAAALAGVILGAQATKRD